MSPITRNNVKIRGKGTQPIVFAHGYGCDQNMWRHVAPAFEDDYRVVLFDHVGCGASDLASYDIVRHGRLAGYARDVLEILAELDIRDAIYVGHSVSAMIGLLASIEVPSHFSKLVLVAPSPCYINDGDYIGGFDRSDIDSLLDFLDDNYLGWAQSIAPTVMGNPERPELAGELANSFCRTDPEISKRFARVTFLSDNRADLPHVATPSLILQCANDALAPDGIGVYLNEKLAGSTLTRMKATGHCPNLSAPEETIAAIRSWLAPDALRAAA
jgi:sigma-B regulation protein RsbQ